MIKGLSLLQLYNSVEFSISLSPCSTLLEKSLKEIQFFKLKLFYKMSTTRSQKRRNDQQSTNENVSEGLISPIVVGNPCSSNQDDEVAGPSRPKSPRIENSLLESLRASLKEEITLEIKTLLIESQKEMLKLLKPETKGIIRENTEEEVEEETRSFYTPTKSVRIGSIQNDPIICRNMVTGVLTDSTNQPKRTKARSQSQPPSKERPVAARTLFATDKNDSTTLPMPKALTASLPTFDGKSEKFELFEDLFRNNIKMYPHLTEIQKINYFHSLLRGDALQAFCNIEDTKKDSLDEIMTIFKRRFGDYLSMAKARCEWDELKFDPSNQKLHEFLDVLQKTAKEAFGSEAQQFIDKAIYAKMPDHVKKILNRAYLEDKPYNDIVLHLEREMRLNGLGAPDEVNLVPLNKAEPAPPNTESKKADNTTQNTKKGYCFYCNKFGHYKAECRKMKRDKWIQTKKNNAQTSSSSGKPLKCDTCGKPHKIENCWNGANSANDPRPKRHFQQERKQDNPAQQPTNQDTDESKN